MLAPEAWKIRQAEQAQQRDQGEVVGVGGLPGGGDQCLELQVSEAKGW
jgi:hypothetical protein